MQPPSPMVIERSGATVYAVCAGASVGAMPEGVVQRAGKCLMVCELG